MAATNYTPIQLYYSTTASAAPTAGNLVNGELAINITDGKLYYKDNGGNVQVIATKGAGTIGGSNTQIQFNDGGALAGNAAMVFNKSTNVTTLTTLNLTNALGATYGGTAQSAYAQGDLLYASAVNTLSKLTIGTVNYILTSTGSVPQWVAPSSVTVQTANNLAGGAGGSVPYQSAADTTTFLAIGAANRVMTSSGSAPQWVTSLTGLTGVSSSSMTNTSLTSGRLVYSTTGGAQTDSANLTFNGTTLSMTGLSNTGFSTIVKTVTLGDSNFNGAAVFAPATPAKLYIGAGTVTDVTSAASATNTTGAITAFGITPIAATNTAVTYTNASTLYIAGAPTAGTNVTITNPYSLYVAGGAAYFGGAVTVAGTISLAGVTVTSLTDSGLTSGRVTYATTGGLLTDSANLLYSGTDLTVYGITVGRGAGAVATNTAVGASALSTNSTGAQNTVVGNQAGATTNGAYLTAVGYQAARYNTGDGNTAIGTNALLVTGGINGTGSNNTAIGKDALYTNTTASNNTAVGYQAGYSNQSGTGLTFVGYQSGYAATTGSQYNMGVGHQSLYGAGSGGLTGIYNTAVGSYRALYNNTTGSENSAFGQESLLSNTSGSYNTAIGKQALQANITASNNTAVGYQAGYSSTGGSDNTAIGYYAYRNGTASYNLAIGAYSMSTATVTGQQNSAVGRYALGALTSGSYNIALGDDSLRNNTTSSSNVAIGFQSLYGYNNSTGGNIAIGDGAMYSVNHTTGSNIAIGTGTLRGSSATGTGNVAIGQGVMYPLTSGGSNTIVGGYNGVDQPPGRYLTTGSYNTVLGTSAFANAIGANNTVAVGYQAAYNAVSVGSSVFVGYQAGYTGNGEYGYNTVVGYKAGYSLSNTSGAYGNTFVGANSQTGTGAGYSVSTGTQNTILGGYSGNQGGLDIRTSSNFIVLSDGAGNPRLYYTTSGTSWRMGNVPTNIDWVSSSSSGDTMPFIYFPTRNDGTYNTSQSGSGVIQYFNDGNGAAPASVNFVRTAGTGGGVTSGSAVTFNATRNTYTPYGAYTNAEVARATGAGVISFANSGFDTAGIQFPASQLASSNANTLDDYEEGTWTPTDASGAGLSLVVTGAFYTKVGNLVTCWFELAYPSTGNTSVAVIGGLPFASKNNSSYRWSCGSGYNNKSVTDLTLYGSYNSSQFNFYLSNGNGIANSSLSSGLLACTFSYQTN